MTGEDPFWVRAKRASIETGLPMRLFAYAWGMDGFDPSNYTVVGGGSRNAAYSWPLIFNVSRPVATTHMRAWGAGAAQPPLVDGFDIEAPQTSGRRWHHGGEVPR